MSLLPLGCLREHYFSQGGGSVSSISFSHRSTTYTNLVFAAALQGRVSKVKQNQPYCNVFLQQIAMLIFFCVFKSVKWWC